MANDSSGPTGVVAIFAIVLMVLVAGFIAWRSGVLGGRAAPAGASHHEQVTP